MEVQYKPIKDPLKIRPLYSKKKERLYRVANRSPLVALLFPSKVDQTQTVLE